MDKGTMSIGVENWLRLNVDAFGLDRTRQTFRESPS